MFHTVEISSNAFGSLIKCVLDFSPTLCAVYTYMYYCPSSIPGVYTQAWIPTCTIARQKPCRCSQPLPIHDVCATRMYMYVHIVLWGECDYGNPSTMCVTGRATRMYMYVHIVLWGECDYGSPASCVGDVMCALYIRLLQHSNCVVQVNCFYTCIIT